MRSALAALAIVAAGFASACARDIPPVRFSVENARAHVDMLAGTIGSRPAGSANNAKARAYLIDQLKLYGFDVRVQDVDAVRADIAMTARVANIIAIKPGARREAIGLVAHYDSVPQAPGAMDDGLGVAVCLEAGRVLAAQEGRTHSLMVILTDGEEVNLMGAAAAITDTEVTGRLRAYLNIESIGAAGDSILFESGPREMPLLDAWASATPWPRGSGYSTEIYKRLPNDTDFTIFKQKDIPGLNFSPVGDSYAYHTSRDTPERLQNATIRHTGESIVATAAALDRTDLATGGREARFFDIAARRAFVYAPFTGRVLTIVAVLLAAVAWVRVLRIAAQRGILAIVVSFLWGVLAIAASIGAMVGAAWLLRASREVFHPWYAKPQWLLLLLIAAGAAAPWYVTRLIHLFPEGGRSLRAPAAIWALMLPVWAALAAAIEYLAPAASHLWTLPLLAASLGCLVIPMSAVWLLRICSLLVACLCGALWLRDATTLYLFMIAVLGRLPVVTPFWLFPAFVAFVGVMVAPPIVAALAGSMRGPVVHGAVGACLLLALALSLTLAYRADAYTPERPQRRVARYVHDVALGQASWEVGGNEPGLDLNLSSPEAEKWRLVPPARDAAAAANATAPGVTPPLNDPFVFRSQAPPIEAPVDVAATMVSRGGETDLEITIVPRQESLWATIVLPPGVDPIRANLTGRRMGLSNRWRATFAAVPMTSGIAFRATVPASIAPKLSETLVIINGSRVGPPDQPRVPAFLPQTRTEWTILSRWVLQPPLAPPAPATPTPAAPAPPPPPGA